MWLVFFSMWLVWVLGIILFLRVLQRIYFLLFGYHFKPLHSSVETQPSPHSSCSKSTPAVDLNMQLLALFKRHDIPVIHHTIVSSQDNAPLHIRILGQIGEKKRYILLANGVGTDLFMWLPILEACLNKDSSFFEAFTFIVPSYRGLFSHIHNEEEDKTTNVKVTMDLCMEDTLQVMAHFHIPSYEAIMGWSTGAQLAITLCARHPNAANRLILLNPSTGHTLHTALQPLIPLPSSMGNLIAKALVFTLGSLIPLCNTPLWKHLKVIAEGPVFRVMLEVLAFMGGFPPYQPIFFHQYMFDAFSCRAHTKALLNLIISLDAACPPQALTLSHDTLIISGVKKKKSQFHFSFVNYTVSLLGLMDFMTGVYHSTKLASGFKNSKHVMFTMGSHFLLIEWPEIIANEIVIFLRKDDNKKS